MNGYEESEAEPELLQRRQATQIARRIVVIRFRFCPRVPHRAGQVQLFQRSQLSDRFEVWRVDIGAHQVERFDAEVARGKVGDIPDSARVAFENHESAHVQRPDGSLAIRVGGE